MISRGALTYRSIDPTARIALTYKNFSECYRSAVTTYGVCLPGGVYRMEKYACGNSGNGGGRIRASLRKSYSTDPCERNCACRAVFKTLYAFFPTLLFHHNNICPVIVVSRSIPIFLVVARLRTHTYVCAMYVSYPYSPFLFLRQHIFLFSPCLF